MLSHKSNHSYGLDTNIYNSCTREKKKDFFFYIWDYCHTKSMITSDFFHEKCNKNNTWNYNLKYEDTSKLSIVRDSPKYGFGDYNISEYSDTQYIVKAISHIYSSERYGQCQLINREDIDKIDKTKYIIQPILKNNKGEELNIYVFKNLNDGEILFSFSYLISHNPAVNINRKDSNVTNIVCELKDVFGEENINKLKNYCKSINLDYGRIELINDVSRGWCVLDINNSPAFGRMPEELIKMTITKYKELFDIVGI